MSIDTDIVEQSSGIVELTKALVRDIARGSLQTRRGLDAVLDDLTSQSIELLSMCQKRDNDAED